MVTDDALEHTEMKPLMCHFWWTIYHMRQVSSQNFVWDYVPKSQEMPPSIPPPCFAPLDPAAHWHQMDAWPNHSLHANEPLNFLQISLQEDYSDVQAFNKHHAAIFTPTLHLVLIFQTHTPPVLEELHIFCNDPVMAELGHVAIWSAWHGQGSGPCIWFKVGGRLQPIILSTVLTTRSRWRCWWAEKPPNHTQMEKDNTFSIVQR